jgi:hypothetical protein
MHGDGVATEATVVQNVDFQGAAFDNPVGPA